MSLFSYNDDNIIARGLSEGFNPLVQQLRIQNRLKAIEVIAEYFTGDDQLKVSLLEKVLKEL